MKVNLQRILNMPETQLMALLSPEGGNQTNCLFVTDARHKGLHCLSTDYPKELWTSSSSTYCLDISFYKEFLPQMGIA